MDAAALPASLLPAISFQTEKKQAIQKIRYSHDAMIDMIVANPWVSQGELAAAFGYTEGWVSQVIASDAFQARLAARKAEIVDPTLRMTIEEKFKGLVQRSYDVLMRKLEATAVSDETALRAMEIASKALGYGPQKAQANIQNNFVVQVPPKCATTSDWLAQHGAGGSTGPNPPAISTRQEVADAVLVESSSAAPPLGAKLLAELKNT